MESVGLAIYLFMFPVIAAVVLGVIWRAAFRQLRESRSRDEIV